MTTALLASAAAFVVQVAHVILPVVALMASGVDAVTAGVPVPVPQVTVGVPATAGTVSVTVPEVDPLSWIAPEAVPATAIPPVPA